MGKQNARQHKQATKLTDGSPESRGNPGGGPAGDEVPLLAVVPEVLELGEGRVEPEDVGLTLIVIVIGIGTVIGVMKVAVGVFLRDGTTREGRGDGGMAREKEREKQWFQG